MTLVEERAHTLYALALGVVPGEHEGGLGWGKGGGEEDVPVGLCADGVVTSVVVGVAEGALHDLRGMLDEGDVVGGGEDGRAFLLGELCVG